MEIDYVNLRSTKMIEILCPWCKKTCDVFHQLHVVKQGVILYQIGCINDNCLVQPRSKEHESLVEIKNAWSSYGIE